MKSWLRGMENRCFYWPVAILLSVLLNPQLILLLVVAHIFYGMALRVAASKRLSIVTTVSSQLIHTQQDAKTSARFRELWQWPVYTITMDT
jgi:hypothetical protein